MIPYLININFVDAMEEFEYEEDNKGNKIIVKSINCETQSMIRLNNRSYCKAEVYWIDYEGKLKFYKSLEHGQFLDLNTFTTHPWIFKDTLFGERLMARNKTVLRGSKVRMLWNSRLQVKIPWRDQVDIVMPMRSLRSLSMMKIVQQLNEERFVSDLGLPPTLSEELTELFLVYQKRKTIIV